MLRYVVFNLTKLFVLFRAKLGIEVTISVEIQAKSQDGFDESLQRTIKENCNVLGFKNSEFEEE